MGNSYQRGWRDRMRGKGWPAAYDKWRWSQQISYEEGRRAAAAAQGLLHNSAEPVQMGDAPLPVIRAINTEKLL